MIRVFTDCNEQASKWNGTCQLFFCLILVPLGYGLRQVLDQPEVFRAVKQLACSILQGSSTHEVVEEKPQSWLYEPSARHRKSCMSQIVHRKHRLMRRPYQLDLVINLHPIGTQTF